jgi:hypothetical protein
MMRALSSVLSSWARAEEEIARTNRAAKYFDIRGLL